MLDAWLPEGAEGPVQSDPAALLRRLELLEEQAGGQEPARSSSTLRQNAEKQVAASQGYDIPPYPKFNDFKTWDEEGPPKGSLSHYPIKGGDQVAGVVCSPAPPLIAAQIWAQSIQAQMVVRYFKGEAMDKVLDWAERESKGSSEPDRPASDNERRRGLPRRLLVETDRLVSQRRLAGHDGDRAGFFSSGISRCSSIVSRPLASFAPTTFTWSASWKRRSKLRPAMPR
mgnify:CR=1 FL=1